ncbi:MAG: hypothetical protein HY700_00010 [Gemmatimonadetes bacterium]|nr:hypothetical protein [Gemmatimonadota bacterium]
MATPVSIDRLVKELEKLKAEMDAGTLKSGDYDRRLARIIQELRDQKLDADRARVNSTLDDLERRGTITAGVKAHLQSRLGLTP